LDTENGLAHNDGQSSFTARSISWLLTPRDVRTNRFSHAFDGFGGASHPAGSFIWLTAMLEGHVLSHQRLFPFLAAFV
jgi:hypothetical protein